MRPLGGAGVKVWTFCSERRAQIEGFELRMNMNLGRLRAVCYMLLSGVTWKKSSRRASKSRQGCRRIRGIFSDFRPASFYPLEPLLTKVRSAHLLRIQFRHVMCIHPLTAQIQKKKRLHKCIITLYLFPTASTNARSARALK
jgi:hypothetical protein